jgi:hypothetical protein
MIARFDRGCVRPIARALAMSALSEYSPLAYSSKSVVIRGPRSGSTSIRCVARLLVYRLTFDEIEFVAVPES